MKRILSSAALLAPLLLAAPPPAGAQEAAANVGELWIVTARNGHQAELEGALKAHTAFLKEHGDPRRWEVYVPITGEQLGRYAVRSCCFSWADQDAYVAWETGQMDALMGHFNEHVAPHVEGVGHYFSRVDLANSNWPDDITYRYVGITTFFIEPGEGVGFNAQRELISQVALNQGWAAAGHHWAWADNVGGAPQVELVVPYANFAAMAPPQQGFFDFLSEKMGLEAAGEALEGLSEATSAVEYSIWMARPDLGTAP